MIPNHLAYGLMVNHAFASCGVTILPRGSDK
jgi:hypothetical protein